MPQEVGWGRIPVPDNTRCIKTRMAMASDRRGGRRSIIRCRDEGVSPVSAPHASLSGDEPIGRPHAACRPDRGRTALPDPGPHRHMGDGAVSWKSDADRNGAAPSGRRLECPRLRGLQPLATPSRSPDDSTQGGECRRAGRKRHGRRVPHADPRRPRSRLASTAPGTPTAASAPDHHPGRPRRVGVSVRPTKDRFHPAEAEGRSRAICSWRRPGAWTRTAPSSSPLRTAMGFWFHRAPWRL